MQLITTGGPAARPLRSVRQAVERPRRASGSAASRGWAAFETTFSSSAMYSRNFFRPVRVSRHIVIADTDAAALAIARRAYPRWRESFRWLFARHGTEPRVIGIYPPTFDELVALNNGIAGSPDTVRRFIEAEVAANNCNYFVPQMVFGSMTLKESLRSVELFAKEIMPAL